MAVNAFFVIDPDNFCQHGFRFSRSQADALAQAIGPHTCVFGFDVDEIPYPVYIDGQHIQHKFNPKTYGTRRKILVIRDLKLDNYGNIFGKISYKGRLATVKLHSSGMWFETQPAPIRWVASR